MDAEFLDHTVHNALTEGLACTVAARPKDPVDYLGNYLLHHAHRIEAEQKLEAEEKVLEEQRAEYEKQQEAEKEHQHQIEAEEKKAAEEKQEIASLLEQCEEVDNDVLRKVVQVVQAQTKATGVYVAKKEPNEPFETEGKVAGGGEDEAEEEGAGGGEEEDEEPSQYRLRYVATSSGQEHLLNQWITDKEGVTFRAWVMPQKEGEEEEEEEEEEEDEEGEAKQKEQKPEPELPIVHVEDAVQDPNVKFFGVPKLGGFTVVPLRYKKLTHPNALPEISVEAPKGEGEEEAGGDEVEEEEEKEEGEEQKEEETEFRIPEGNSIDEDLAICFDAVGQNRPFSDAEVEFVKDVATRLRDAFNRAEKRKYEEEYTRAYEYKKLLSNPPDSLKEELEEEKSNIDEQKAEKLGELGEEAHEDQTQLVEAQSNQRLARASLKIHEQHGYLEPIYNSRICPSAEAIKVVQCVLYALGYDKASLGDPNSLDKLKFSWETTRVVLREDFVQKLEDYDVESHDFSSLKPYQKAEHLKSTLENIDRETVASTSPVYPLLIDWVNAIISGSEAVEKRKQREQEEAEKAAAEAAAAEGAGEEEKADDEEEED